MKAEHCSKAGATKDFTSSNYNITTNPQREWLIVVEGMQCPEHQMGHGRTIEPITLLMTRNGALRAGLTEVEVIAVVLYTGPMVCLHSKHIFAHNNVIVPRNSSQRFSIC
jgi:hypothetical protein